MPAALREAELAERRDVGADALLGEQAEQRDVRERLRPVDDERVGRGRAVGAGVGAERRLVVDDERAPVRGDELGRGDAAERERAAVDRGGVGEEREHVDVARRDTVRRALGAILPVDGSAQSSTHFRCRPVTISAVGSIA